MIDFATADFWNVTFDLNEAHNRAVIQTHTYSFFVVDNCKFLHNRARTETAVIHIEDSQDISGYVPGLADEEAKLVHRDGKQSKLRNSVVKYNSVQRGGGALIRLAYANFSMENATVA